MRLSAWVVNWRRHASVFYDARFRRPQRLQEQTLDVRRGCPRAAYDQPFLVLDVAMQRNVSGRPMLECDLRRVA